MSRYDDLINRARCGEAIVIDGATGSECLKRGGPSLHNGWSGGAALTHPEIVKAIHADYIALGVDLFASNSFAAGRNVLEDAGAEAIKVATKYVNVDAFCLMHSDVRLTERSIAEIRKYWHGPIGAYAHSARYRDGKLDFEDNVTPEQNGSYKMQRGV